MGTRPFQLRRAAVLGAGVMGAQIAAHLANAGVPVLLFELPAGEGERNGDAVRAIRNLLALEHGPLALPEAAHAIRPANYDDDLAALAQCELIVEAIVERVEAKTALYRRIAPHVQSHSALVTNTSSLAIDTLAEALPEGLRTRYCGMHFFNPPRYMHLVELVPGTATDGRLLDALEQLLVVALGKGVVRARDKPGFIGNRVGVFSLLAVVHHAARLGLGLDEADALTGRVIGRPRTATLHTADMAGLDVVAEVLNGLHARLPDDPWRRYYTVPPWMQSLIGAGALGRKAGRGVYRKTGETIEVLDIASGRYRPLRGTVDDAVAALRKDTDVQARFARLHTDEQVQSRFLWGLYRDTFHYCAYHLADIADTARDVDLALRWGFGWDRGPFETWQSAGWQAVVTAIQEDIASGQTMCAAPLPAWATDPRRTGVHSGRGSYSPVADRYTPRSRLPVYRRQPHADRLAGEPAPGGETIFETPAVRCWHGGDDVAVLSFKTPQHTVDEAVLEGLLQAVEVAERGHPGLVVWQTEPPFSAGANLKRSGDATAGARTAVLVRRLRHMAQPFLLRTAQRLGVADTLTSGRMEAIERLIVQFQRTHRAVRYSLVPVVAAVDGLALGAGCELLMHSDRSVASLESYPGFVEAGLGLIPAAGGCKELAVRAARDARSGDLFGLVQRCFSTVATATVARSARHAQALGYLTPADRVVMNRHEVLHVAKSEVRALAEAGYRPPLPARVAVAGRGAIATLKAYMVNLLEGRRISEHDMLVGERLATVLCGGDVDAGSIVDEQWLLDLEREHFMQLLATEKTRKRIEHMLKTGKPLRN
jgi:3-hydroxyacyl-CoA dehydrogenase